jgi:general secretion pathway protein M
VTELLINLVNAPRAIQRATAIGLFTLLLLSLVWLAIWSVSILDAKADQIETLREDAYRLSEIIRRRPLAASPSLQIDQALFTQGESVAVVQAKLQERLNSVSLAAGAAILSVAGIPQATIDHVNYVGLRVSFQGSLPAVHEVLRQLESSVPPLIIPQARLHSETQVAEGSLSEPIKLSAEIVVLAAVDPALGSAGKAGP